VPFFLKEQQDGKASFLLQAMKRFAMEQTALIKLLKTQQEEGFDALYKTYSDKLFQYIHHIVNNRALAIELLNETFSKLRNETPVINYNTGSVFTWLIEETIQVILENCPEKHGEIRKQIISETHLLNITDDVSEQHFCIHHLVATQDSYLRRSA
jgi:DNA-directed RNA polymerase specialized sigma24 family protein